MPDPETFLNVLKSQVMPVIGLSTLPLARKLSSDDARASVADNFELLVASVPDN